MPFELQHSASDSSPSSSGRRSRSQGSSSELISSTSFELKSSSNSPPDARPSKRSERSERPDGKRAYAFASASSPPGVSVSEGVAIHHSSDSIMETSSDSRGPHHKRSSAGSSSSKRKAKPLSQSSIGVREVRSTDNVRRARTLGTSTTSIRELGRNKYSSGGIEGIASSPPPRVLLTRPSNYGFARSELHIAGKGDGAPGRAAISGSSLSTQVQQVTRDAAMYSTNEAFELDDASSGLTEDAVDDRPLSRKKLLLSHRARRNSIIANEIAAAAKASPGHVALRQSIGSKDSSKSLTESISHADGTDAYGNDLSDILAIQPAKADIGYIDSSSSESDDTPPLPPTAQSRYFVPPLDTADTFSSSSSDFDFDAEPTYEREQTRMFDPSLVTIEENADPQTVVKLLQNAAEKCAGQFPELASKVSANDAHGRRIALLVAGLEHPESVPRMVRHLTALSMVQSSAARDWNAEFQKLKQERDGIEKFQQLSQLAHDFAYCARTFGKIILAEVCLPDEEKTIKPIGIGGVAGGQKFIISGILFKFAADQEIQAAVTDVVDGVQTTHYESRGWMYGGGTGPNDEKAMKAAAHEFNGCVAYNKNSVSQLNVPLIATIDYRGFRLTAVSLVPVNKATLVYGSCDGGRTIHHDDAKVNKLMARAGREMNLAGHEIGGSGFRFYGPGDIEAHIGLDGRVYVLDFARVFPPESPHVTKEKDRRAVFFKLLRPEFVRAYDIEPLSSDAFTAWGKVNRSKYDDAASRATQFLLDRVIPDFAEKCLRRPDIQARFQEKLHRHGINCRFLGRIRACVIDSRANDNDSEQALRDHLLNEMVARVIKNTLRHLLRHQMRERGTLAEEPYKTVILQFLNDTVLCGSSVLSDDFWRREIKILISAKYEFGLSAQELDPNTHLLKSGAVRLLPLLRRLQEVTPFRLSTQVLSALERLDRDFRLSGEANKLGIFQLSRADLVKLSARVKHMNVMDVAEARALTLEASQQPLPALSLKIAGTGSGGHDELSLHTTESDRLFEQAHKLWEKCLASVPDDAESLFEWGNSFFRQAKRKLNLWKRLVQEQQSLAVAHLKDTTAVDTLPAVGETPAQAHLLDAVELEVLRLIANALKKFTTALLIDTQSSFQIEATAGNCLFLAAIIKGTQQPTQALALIQDATVRIRRAVEIYRAKRRHHRRRTQSNTNVHFIEDLRDIASSRYKKARAWIQEACLPRGKVALAAGADSARAAWALHGDACSIPAFPRKPVPLRYRNARNNVRNVFAIAKLYLESAVHIMNATLDSSDHSRSMAELTMDCGIWMAELEVLQRPALNRDLMFSASLELFRRSAADRSCAIKLANLCTTTVRIAVARTASGHRIASALPELSGAASSSTSFSSDEAPLDIIGSLCVFNRSHLMPLDHDLTERLFMLGLKVLRLLMAINGGSDAPVAEKFLLSVGMDWNFANTKHLLSGDIGWAETDLGASIGIFLKFAPVEWVSRQIAGARSLRFSHGRAWSEFTDASLASLVEACLLRNGIGLHDGPIAELDLSRCVRLSNRSLATLGTVLPGQTLRYLQLNHCLGLRDSGLIRILRGHSASLKLLEVRGCFQLSDMFATRLVVRQEEKENDSNEFVPLLVCPKLRLFALSETGRFTRAGVRALTVIFPNLVSLELSRIRSLTDVSDVARFKFVREVNLKHCHRVSEYSVLDFLRGSICLRGFGLRGLASVTEHTIEVLSSMYTSKASSRLLTTQDNLQMLQWLDLRDTSVSDEKPLRRLLQLVGPALRVLRLPPSVKISDACIKPALAAHSEVSHQQSWSKYSIVESDMAISSARRTSQAFISTTQHTADPAEQKAVALPVLLTGRENLFDPEISLFAVPDPKLSLPSATSTLGHLEELHMSNTRCGAAVLSKLGKIVQRQRSEGKVHFHALVMSGLSRPSTQTCLTAIRMCADALMELDVSFCEHVTTIVLETIFVSCPRLCKLSAGGLEDKALHRAVENCLGDSRKASKVSSLLTHLDVSHTPSLRNAHVVFLSSHYVNLRCVCIGRCDALDDTSIRALAENCRMLTKLRASRCKKVTFACVQDLSKLCAHLEELDLTMCCPPPILDRDLAEIRNKERLAEESEDSMSSCNDVSQFGVVVDLPRLRKLNVESCWWFGNAAALTVSRGCPSVEVLNLTRCDLVNDLCVDYISRRMPHLRELILKSHDGALGGDVTDRSVRMLAARCKHLQVLDVSTRAITDVSLRYFVHGFPHLSLLTLPNPSRAQEHMYRPLRTLRPSILVKFEQ